jgi:hypothetical protein
MKKIAFSFIILSILSCTSTVSQQPDRNNQKYSSLTYILNGEYAFYLDKRGEDHFYRGYMRFLSNGNKNIVIARSIRLRDGKEERFMFTVSDDENGYPTEVTDIEGEFNEIEFKQALPDFLNFTTLYLRTENEYEIQKDIDDEWGNYTLVFSFNKILPFFRFYDIKQQGSTDDRGYTLEYGGILSSDNVQDFFKFTPIARGEERQRIIPTIPQKDDKIIEINGINITLDENWQFNNLYKSIGS